MRSIICICLFLTNLIFITADDLACESNSNFTSLNENGQPLFLTPYITKGLLEAAREDSKVGRFEGVPCIPSYSGFLTVNPEYNSNIFFWFFPAANNNQKAPVILWLQGGPGASGLMGLFLEHGPYVVYSNNSIGLRELPWTQSFHMIYVDNPVGSGFSFTDDEKGYSTNQEEITDNLYEFLQQFFILFPEFRDNDFYISGESYGGKHAPSLAYRIHTNGLASKINLKGITIGNGLIDPPSIAYNVDFYYELGVFDHRQTAELRTLVEGMLQNIRNDEYEEALNLLSYIFPNFDSIFVGRKTLLEKYAGYTFIYNFLYHDKPEEYNYYLNFIQEPRFRKATHIGNLPFRGQDTVKKYLKADILKSVEDQLVVIMNNYKVLIYNGVLDLSISYIQSAKFLRNLQWKYANEYLEVERKIWRISENEIAGYIHNVGDFSHASVLLAGHLVPHDNPRAAFGLITRFINGTLVSSFF